MQDFPGSNDAGTHRHSSGHKQAMQRMDDCVAYMKQNLDQHLDVSRLTTVAGISTSYFFALFKLYTGYSPIGYFTQLKMDEACRLLCQTKLSVKQVAASLGFDDPFHFSRVFKAANNVSPREYRTRLIRGINMAFPEGIHSMGASPRYSNHAHERCYGIALAVPVTTP
jgi:AraC-like DNA-binding protein